MRPAKASPATSRREVLSLFSAAGAGAALPLWAIGSPLRSGAGLPGAPVPPVLPNQSLGEIASRADILFGASIGHKLPEDYASLYVREARILTTDTALKFDFLRPAADRYSFGAADSILAFAKRHRLPLRGHTLVWNENAPAWLKGMNGHEIERVFESHLETVVARYHGQLHSWDVVNEPIWPMHGKAGGFRNGPWLEAMGASYVPRAFARVHALDKNVKLCLNEAHCELDNEWGQGIRPQLLALVDRLLDLGIPLGAVGLQGHLVPEWGSSDEIFQAYLVEIASRGVDIYITELDISDRSFPRDPAARDAAVALRYGSFLRHVLAVPQVKIVETWQLADKYSWYRGTEPGARPLPFDDRLQAKPARDAMASAFQQRKT